MISFYSETALPFLHLSANSYIFGIVLTMAFILLIGHEIPASFINVITSGVRQTKSLRHFLVISGFYLLNLILAYIKEIGYLDWNIWLINTYVLLTLSAVLSIWGFLQRCHQDDSMFVSESLAAFLILALGIISFTTFDCFSFQPMKMLLKYCTTLYSIVIPAMASSFCFTCLPTLGLCLPKTCR